MLSSFSVKKPYTVIVAVIAIIIIGVVSLQNMTTDLMPNINIPYAVVITTYPGASPEQVELGATRPVEQAVSSLNNIKNVRSVSRENMSLVILEFNDGTNMDSVSVEMRENLDRITNYLPDGVSSPMIMKLNPSMMPVMVISADMSGKDVQSVSRLVEDKIVPGLESVEGVASSNLSGLVDNQINVIIRREMVDSVNKSISDAVAAQKAKAEKAFTAAAAQISAELLTSGKAVPGTEPGVLVDAQTGSVIDIAAMTMEKLGLVNMPAQSAAPTDFSVSVDMIKGLLTGQNFSMPAGYTTEDNIEYLVRAGSKLDSIDDLKNLLVAEIPLEGVEPIHLNDVAEVIVTDNSSESYNRLNGNPSVTITLQKQTEYSTADVAKRVRDKMDSLMESNEGLHLVALMDQGVYVDMIVNSVFMNLLVGGGLAIIVLILFLRDLRPTFVIALSIPISLVSALILMYFSGVTLNIISMSGLALGVGMLVDNSIVVIENIYRLRSDGKNAKEAAIYGAREVAGAITASTLTTVAVFLPIVFVKGIAKDLFTDMGLTIAYSLLASLAIALTLVPMAMAGALRNGDAKKHRFMEFVQAKYGKILELCLRYKPLVLLVSVGLLVLSTWGILRNGTQFIPAIDTEQLSVGFTVSEGSSVEDLSAAADDIMKRIAEIPEVKTVGAMSGNAMGVLAGGTQGGSSQSVTFYVMLDEKRNRSNTEIADDITARTADINGKLSVSGSDNSMTMLTGDPISVNIMGPDLDKLSELARQVKTAIEGVKGTTELTTSADGGAKEMRIVVNRDKAIVNQLTAAQVYMQVSAVLADSTAAASITFDGIDYDIYVKSGEVQKPAPDELADIVITTPAGKALKVSDVAEVVEGFSSNSVNHNSGQRYVSVTGQLEEGYNVGLVNEEIDKALKNIEVPTGYTVSKSGESETIASTFKDLYLLLGLSIVLIYLIMVAQFQSLLSPFIVMFTIPLAFTGAFLALLIGGMPISVVALVGLVILAGVVVNNGIVFVDYANRLIQGGMSQREALVMTGKTRMRPIIMTALTTIIAMSTMSVGMGTGTAMVQPMAVTSIGGLAYATFMTLFVVPVIYDLLHRKGKKAVSAGEKL